MSPWLNLSPSEFEEFGYRLLELNGFKNLRWHGAGGGDRGRDIVCTKLDKPLPGVERQSRWVVQCKHYGRAKVTKAIIHDWLAACREHTPDNVLLIVSRSISSNLKDWPQAVSSEYSFYIHSWEEADLGSQYWKHRSRLQKIFPNLPKANGKVRFVRLV